MRHLIEYRFLTVNLDLLERFEKPTSAWEVFKHGFWTSYAGVHKEIRRLHRMGLITLVYCGPNKKNGIKKLYLLTDRGRSLLGLFPNEALIQGEEDP